MPPPNALQERLARLLCAAEGRASREILLGVERTRRILARLNHPERGLSCLHVAGTNGKGSVIAFLAAMLEASGVMPGVYTSPHLERFNERIRMGRDPIADDALVAVLEASLAAAEGEEATFFEITTCAAFLAFARAAPPWVLLETGLGGRLDATRVVMPRLCIITSIGLDHQAYLGESIGAIAREKGGILHPGVPLVCDPVAPEAVAVLEEMAHALGVPCLRRGAGYDYALLSDGRWRYRDGAGEMSLPPPALPGRHQYANAALAVAAARQLAGLGLFLTEEEISAGVRHACWPGRMERFAGPPAVWLDGAHNPAAVAALAQALHDLGLAPVHLVFSVLADKDAAAMVALLSPLVASVHLVAMGGSRSRTLEELVALWEGVAVPVTPCGDPAGALHSARSAAVAGGDVVVAGSLYLVGAVRTLLI